ncbi:MAG: hypothetical protein GF408_03890 [Candidatus Omnitrophica bacterium]|nr:hypothetical protein [Candidatus Omnitrophota bacterium]
MGFFRKRGLPLLLVPALAFGLALAGCGREREEADREVTATKPAEEQEVPPVPSVEPITEERTFYDFESNLNGWEVPMWALGKTDYVAQNPPLVSKDAASKGEASMKVMMDYPGGKWAAGLVEIQQFLDISPYRAIMTDIYLPADAPEGLKAKIILTVGSNWKFVEMSQSIPLVPGEWTTIKASIEPGSYDWKRVVPDETFAEDIRKIAIRVVSNNKPVYNGPVYIDNIRVGR